MGENRGVQVPRPYADPTETVKALGQIAASDTIRIQSEDGRELIIPPQIEPRTEEARRSTPAVVPQEIRPYDIYEALEGE